MTRGAFTHGRHGRHGGLAGCLGGVILTAVLAGGAQAVEPPTVPTAAAGVAAPRCTVGQPCTFAAPIFACDLAGAEKLAQAGPARAREVGLGLVREGTCRTVLGGHPLGTEATKITAVVYLTERGQHLGYMPAGVFASLAAAAQAPCEAPGFCAVRPNAPTMIRPDVASLALPTPEAKSAAKCLRIGEYNVGEATSVSGDTLVLANMFGGKPPYQPVYREARRDFVRLDMPSPVTPAARGGCRPGAWCATTAPTLFCADRAAHARVQASPPGEPRRLALQAEPGCRIVIPGNVLKPSTLPTAGDVQKLIAAEHPVLAAGVVSANAFGEVSYAVP